MMKIYICDVCKAEGKLTETSRYISVKGRPDLRIDYCETCKPKIPKDMEEYEKFVYKTRLAQHQH